MNKAKRKRRVKCDEEDGSHADDHVSVPATVAKNATNCVVKVEVTAQDSTAAEVGADDDRNCSEKQSVGKRRRAVVSPGSVQGEVDAEVKRPRRTKTSPTYSQNIDEPLQQDKRSTQSVKKTQPSVKRQTRTRKSLSTLQKKNASKEQSETTIETVGKKSKRVKHEPQAESAVENDLDKMSSVKTEKSDVAHTSTLNGSCRKFIGAHMSISGGLWNAVLSTLEIGGSALGLFLRSQRTWHCKPLDDGDAELFKKTLKESGISPWMVVPHGSYLLNCGSSDGEVLRKTRETLVDELKRCEKLGLPIYNFHPGSSKGEVSRQECIEKIADSINYVHSQTANVITVIENMSCQGNTIGGKFFELRQIIDLVTDKSRVGVCLDSCHAFAAGYDIRSEKGYEQMKAEFEEVIGRQYLKAVHLNDSKGDLGCHLDRHENIGRGKLGMSTFRRIMNDPFFNDLPMILETPEGDYRREVQSLYKLVEQ